MTHEWNYNFYGRGCCDSRDHGDPHRLLARPVSDSRHDTDKTEPNAPRLIYLARWNTKQTNRQRRAALFLSIHF